MQALSSDSDTRRGLSDGEAIAGVASGRTKKPAGRRKFREMRHPVYWGVRRRNAEKWVCEVREPNKKSRIWLGTFPTPEMAARAHDVAVMALRGSSACLNFPESASTLPVPESGEAKDIQKAAAAAAELFRPLSALETKNLAIATSPEDELGLEEEAETPELLAEMAEGMLLSPPRRDGFQWDDMAVGDDVSLWSWT